MKKNNIAIIGLGYVGLPLFFELSTIHNVKGFDINSSKITELSNSVDRTNLFPKSYFKKNLINNFTDNYKDIDNCNIFIVCVPTPIKVNLKPDLKYLKDATKILGKILKKNDIVVYESTVYPGCTEEFCVPILENYSNMKLVTDNSKNKNGFYVCYSPERINPGDNLHTIKNITKVLAGFEKKSTKLIFNIYNKITNSGVYVAKNVKTAEAAKIIENTQRDLNIALVNELSIIFDRLNIEIDDVLKAARTKWNFINFVPGLVGGHCIGVDPYYLTYISKLNKYDPETILSGRRINDNFHNFIIYKLIKQINERNINRNKCKILIMGYTFKENISDFRNSKVSDLVYGLIKNNIKTSIYDPHVNLKIMKDNIIKNKFVKKSHLKTYDIILITVPHKIFLKYPKRFYEKLVNKNYVIFEIKRSLKHNLNIVSL